MVGWYFNMKLWTEDIWWGEDCTDLITFWDRTEKRPSWDLHNSRAFNVDQTGICCGFLSHRGTPKSSILVWCSIRKPSILWDTPSLGNPYITNKNYGAGSICFNHNGMMVPNDEHMFQRIDSRTNQHYIPLYPHYIPTKSNFCWYHLVCYLNWG